ncbi:MAG: energy transducer TonB [Spirochaetaceae bacterium]|nr:energy transducer TonB [Spirochaetaceae bacterium]MDT8296765.1 energy transducer TonB [Spirochaetaceae bacterium]
MTEESPIKAPIREESLAPRPATPLIDPAVLDAAESEGSSEVKGTPAEHRSGMPTAVSADPVPLPTAPPTEPAPLEPIKPEYPRLARRMGLEGTVVLILTINETGRIEDFRVEESQAHPLLVDAAVETAMAVRYKPGTRGLKPVADTLTLRIVFRLET